MASTIDGQEKLVSLRLDSTDYGTTFSAKASSKHSPGKAGSKKRVLVFISTHVEEIKAAMSAPFSTPTAAPATSNPEDTMAVEEAITQTSAAALESLLKSPSTTIEQHPASLAESPFSIVQQAFPVPEQPPCDTTQCPNDLADNPASAPDSMLVDSIQVDNTPEAGLNAPCLTTPKSSSGMMLLPAFISPFIRSKTTKQDSVNSLSKPSTPLTNSNSSSNSPKALLSKFSNSMGRIKAVFSSKAPAPADDPVGADASAASEVPSGCSIPSTPSSPQRIIKRMKFNLASFKAPFKLSFIRKPSKKSSTVGRVQPPPPDVSNSSSTITTDPSNEPYAPAPPVAKSASSRLSSMQSASHMYSLYKLSSMQSAAKGSLHRLISKAKGIGKKRKQHPAADQV